MKERLNQMDKLRFCQLLYDWQCFKIERNSKVIGAVIHKDGFAHIGIDKSIRGKWATKQLIKAMIEKAQKNGKLFTTVFHNDKFRKDFAERMGFCFVKTEGTIDIYEVSL